MATMFDVIILIAWFFVGPLITNAQDPTVRTSYGDVIGRNIFTDAGRNVFAFQGIPYAQAPIGELRFQPPKVKSSWRDIWDARQFRWVCPQLGRLQSFAREDCLYLNIYTPTVQQSSFLPVLFWIHEGDFNSGSSASVIPQGVANNLVSRDIVVVTINYRLGPLGFFTTGNDVLTKRILENLGLLDQLFALRWVRENIYVFGGSPEDITIGGNGAGATSVSLISLSPLAEGLFKRIILQSGSSVQPGLLDEGRVNNASRNMVVNSGCGSTEDWQSKQNLAAVVTCLKSLSAAELISAANRNDEAGQDFGPVMDNYFLSTDLSSLLNTRRPYPTLIGVTKDEYGDKYINRLIDNADFLYAFDRQIYGAQIITGFQEKLNSLEKIIPKIAIALYATEENRRDNDNLYWFNQYLQAMSDATVVGPAYLEAISLARRQAAVFFYQFDFLSPAALQTSPWKGVIHSWELQYIFGSPGIHDRLNFTATPTDRQMALVFGNLWANFIKFGDPTPSSSPFLWTPMHFDSANKQISRDYLSITPAPQMRDNLAPKALNIWTDLVPEMSLQKNPDMQISDECYSSIYFIGLWISLGSLLVLSVAFLIVICFCDLQRHESALYEVNYNGSLK